MALQLAERLSWKVWVVFATLLTASSLAFALPTFVPQVVSTPDVTVVETTVPVEATQPRPTQGTDTATTQYVEEATTESRVEATQRNEPTGSDSFFVNQLHASIKGNEDDRRVRISGVVSNPGRRTVTQNVTLRIEGNVTDEKSVRLREGQNRIVAFEIALQSPGRFTYGIYTEQYGEVDELAVSEERPLVSSVEQLQNAVCGRTPTCTALAIVLQFCGAFSAVVATWQYFVARSQTLLDDHGTEM